MPSRTVNCFVHSSQLFLQGSEVLVRGVPGNMHLLNSLLLQSCHQALTSPLANTLRCLLPDDWFSQAHPSSKMGHFLVQSPKNLYHSQESLLSSPAPTKSLAIKQSQIPSGMWRGISGTFELTISMPLCSLAIHTARGLGKPSCETGKKTAGSDLRRVHHAFYQCSLSFSPYYDLLSSLHFNYFTSVPAPICMKC